MLLRCTSNNQFTSKQKCHQVQSQSLTFGVSARCEYPENTVLVSALTNLASCANQRSIASTTTAVQSSHAATRSHRPSTASITKAESSGASTKPLPKRSSSSHSYKSASLARVRKSQFGYHFRLLISQTMYLGMSDRIRGIMKGRLKRIWSISSTASLRILRRGRGGEYV